MLEEEFCQFSNHPGELIQKYDNISRQIADIQLTAEKQCSSSHHGHPWSPTIAKCAIRVQFWTKILRCTKLHHAPSPLIQKYAVQHNINTNISLTAIVGKLRAAKVTLCKSQKDAADLHAVHLDDRANLYAALKQKSKQTIINNIINAETTRSMFRKLLWAISPN